jgi:hypothetical protein
MTLHDLGFLCFVVTLDLGKWTRRKRSICGVWQRAILIEPTNALRASPTYRLNRRYSRGTATLVPKNC